jgi:toxin ParE1/3/4
MKVVIAPRAIADLADIDAYTLATWGRNQAVAYSELMAKRIATLRDAAERGAPLDHVRPGLRRVPAGSHFIFYVVKGEDVKILRVMHHARDYRRRLG